MYHVFRTKLRKSVRNFTRFAASVPKQFVNVNNIPLIIHTLRKFQIPIIDSVIAVCIDGYIPYLKDLIEQYEIKKILSIVHGGSSAFESIRCGFKSLPPDISDKDIVIIHDSVRPLLPEEVIIDAVEKAKIFGNGCASLKSIEGLVLRNDDTHGIEPADRFRIMRVQTPQAYQYGLLKNLFDRAEHDGRNDFAYTEELCMNYGVPIYFSKSFTGNLKITTRPDIAFFKAMMQFSDDELMGKII